MGEVLLIAVVLGLVVAGLWLAAVGGLGLLRRLLGWDASRRREAEEAEHRARALLRDVLTADEYARLVAQGCLDVPSTRHPGRVYRVPRDGGIVVVYEGERAIVGLCVQAVKPIPAADVVAMHKLMIEGAEAEYLHRANRVGFAASCRFGGGGRSGILDLRYALPARRAGQS